MGDDNDPRVFFAAERTLLAWLRTGLAIIGVGFVVAKFGMFVRIVEPSSQAAGKSVVSTVIGVAFVLLGAVAVAGATWQHAKFIRPLTGGQRPSHHAGMFAVWISIAVAAAGVALAVYLGLG